MYASDVPLITLFNNMENMRSRRPSRRKIGAQESGLSLSGSEQIVLKIVNKGKPVTGVTAAKITGWTRNHCSMVLTSLHKKGLIRRYQDKGNHTRWYVYTKKEEA